LKKKEREKKGGAYFGVNAVGTGFTHLQERPVPIIKGLGL